MFPFPTFSPTVSAGSSGILDGFSPTGAWSLSRDLLSAYAGGSRYTDISGAITTLTDQSGNSRNITDNTTVGQRPTLTTAGPNSRAAADFDGVNNFMSGAAISNFISASSGLIIIGCMVDAFTLNSALSYQNDLLIGDPASNYCGIYLRNTAGGTAYAYNWDGNEDKATGTLTTATPYVLHWRHEGGTVYLGINGTETSAASGNTQVMTGALRLAGSGIQESNCKVFEAATFSTIPSGANITAIVNDMKTWIGA